MKKKIPRWTGDAVKRMHLDSISTTEVAKEIGWSRNYLWLVLSGNRTPKGAREKVMSAIESITSREAG